MSNFTASWLNIIENRLSVQSKNDASGDRLDAPPADSTIAALIELADSEFRAKRYEASVAVARLAYHYLPDDPKLRRILAQEGISLREDAPSDILQTQFHYALGEAYRLLGNNENAESHYRAALGINNNFSEARIGLTLLRMPGEDFRAWLERFHTILKPATYLEIGVFTGCSLALAHPPTRAIGVDPAPKISFEFKAETHLFTEMSDEFFAQRHLASLLQDSPLALAFIDGGHTFEQALRDFINIEGYCGPRSVILMHDTVPLDEAMQNRVQQIAFYAGDIWRTALCLKHYRPNLDIFTIATPWTGLTVVTGLDPASRVLSDNYQAAVARFNAVPFSEIENCMETALNIVPNDRHEVEAHLKARGLLPAER